MTEEFTFEFTIGFMHIKIKSKNKEEAIIKLNEIIKEEISKKIKANK